MLMEQLRYFPKARYDDAVDSLELAVHVAEKRRIPTVKILGGGGGGDADWGPFYRALRP